MQMWTALLGLCPQRLLHYPSGRQAAGSSLCTKSSCPGAPSHASPRCQHPAKCTRSVPSLAQLAELSPEPRSSGQPRGRSEPQPKAPQNQTFPLLRDSRFYISWFLYFPFQFFFPRVEHWIVWIYTIKESCEVNWSQPLVHTLDLGCDAEINDTEHCCPHSSSQLHEQAGRNERIVQDQATDFYHCWKSWVIQRKSRSSRVTNMTESMKLNDWFLAGW